LRGKITSGHTFDGTSLLQKEEAGRKLHCQKNFKKLACFYTKKALIFMMFVHKSTVKNVLYIKHDTPWIT